MSRYEREQKAVDANTQLVKDQINQALEVAGFNEKLRLGWGNSVEVQNLRIWLKNDMFSVYPRNISKIMISVNDRDWKVKTLSMKIPYVKGKPAIDKMKFIQKVEKQEAFAKAEMKARDGREKKLRDKQALDRQIAEDLEAYLGVEFSHGHCYLDDLGIVLKLRGGKVKIEGEFTPGNVIQIVRQLQAARK